jgi:hypothetical protein
VHGNPLALGEDLHGSARQAHLDLVAREAVGNAVEVALDIDVVVDADPAHAPFREDIGGNRQGLEQRPIEVFEELPAGDAEPADRARFVELPQQLDDRCIELG